MFLLMSFIIFITLYLIIIIFLPVLNQKEQNLKLSDTAAAKPDCREDITYKVGELSISGWLYLPSDNTKKVPCVVMSHGFCGTKDMGLEKYALNFIDAGFAALIIDYRYFGKSEGEPRQLYSKLRQLEDVKGAIKYVRSRKEIDPDSIVFWGTSSSADYGLFIASEDKKIKAIIGQVPSLDHQADGKMIVKREGLKWFLKLIINAQRDKGRSRFGLSPHRFAAVGEKGTTAMFTADDSVSGYQRLAQESTTFRNQVCARLMLETREPDIIRAAEKTECPVLFFVCENDSIISPGSYKKVENILGKKVEIIKYPIGHFDIYFDEYFEKCIKKQIDFLKKVF